MTAGALCVCVAWTSTFSGGTRSRRPIDAGSRPRCRGRACRRRPPAAPPSFPCGSAKHERLGHSGSCTPAGQVVVAEVAHQGQARRRREVDGGRADVEMGAWTSRIRDWGSVHLAAVLARHVAEAGAIALGRQPMPWVRLASRP